MATEQQINEWKTQHGSIYRANVGGTDYIFRTLNRDDYIAIQGKALMEGVNFDNEYEVVKTCLLEGFDEQDMKNKGGIVSVLSEKIMLRSGFQQVEEEEL